MSDDVLLEARSLSKTYQHETVLDNIDFGVHKGQVKVIVGASGSGKSTLLRLLALLEPPDAGSIMLEGKPLGLVPTRKGKWRTAGESVLAAQRESIGMVFQSFNLFPHLSVVDNVALALRVVHSKPKAECITVAESMLERVGLAERRFAFPAELSGGQQQRVAIARALVMSPKVMLFDEPTSALDPALVREVLTVIEGLARDGMTMLVVTHELGFARDIADTIVMFDKGRILEESPPDEFFNVDSGHPGKIQFLSHAHTPLMRRGSRRDLTVSAGQENEGKL